MHFHAIILAALSAGALSVSLTAKHPTHFRKPNVKCKGKDNGMNVNIDIANCPKHQPDCNCHLYEPPDGSPIWIDYADSLEAMHGINVFSDTDCQNFLTTILPSTTLMNISNSDCESCSDSASDCVPMGDGVHWGSVMAGDIYSGPGVTRPNG